MAIAAAIQNRYGIRAVPHIISRGFSKEETEYALIDLSFLGVTDLLLLRGDTRKLDADQLKMDSHLYATGLQEQVNNFNQGIAFDGSTFTPPEVPFSYGMACYPEKHEESPNMEAELFYTKMKVDQGADYLVTQMFFDNSKYFAFVDRCRAAGITVPIIPGIKVLKSATQLVSVPKNFYIDFPDQLVEEVTKDPKNVAAIGKEWATRQVEDLLNKGAPCVHFYIMNDTGTIVDIVKKFQK